MSPSETTFLSPYSSGCAAWSAGHPRDERPLRLPFGTRTLAVVAPHPDDETLAAGGLIFDLIHGGWNVSIVVVTDGAASHPGVIGLSNVRANECRNAVRSLGLAGWPTFLGFPDGQAEAHVDKVAIALRLVLSGVDVIVAPRNDDGHSDHHATAEALAIAFDSSGPSVLHYAIWGWEQLDEDRLNIDAAEVFRPSPAALRAKRRALRCYQSQTTSRYGDVILGEDLLQRHTSETEVFWW